MILYIINYGGLQRFHDWSLGTSVIQGFRALDPVVPSVQDGVRTTKDETVSSLDGTDCLGAVLDGVDGRRLQTREIAQ